MSEQKCRFCGCKNAIYYNEQLNMYYCPDCTSAAYAALSEILPNLIVDAEDEDE